MAQKSWIGIAGGCGGINDWHVATWFSLKQTNIDNENSKWHVATWLSLTNEDRQ